MASKEWFTWTVQFRVRKTWVEDGFDLDNEQAKSMLARDLQSAHGSEISARVIGFPQKHEILEAQGYSRAEIFAKIFPNHTKTPVLPEVKS